MPTVKKAKNSKQSSVGKEKQSFVGDQTKSFSRQPYTPPNNETRFWAAVAEKSQSMIADLIEKVLPISAIPSVFNLESDVDYRVLLREDLPRNYEENEEYLSKIESGNWIEDDVEYVAEDLTCQYFEIVVKSLVDWLSDYRGFETTSLNNLERV